MRTRLLSCAVVAAMAPPGWVARGQEPPRYYPPQVVPAPAGMYGTPVGRPAGAQPPAGQDPRGTPNAKYNGPPSLAGSPPDFGAHSRYSSQHEAPADRPKLSQPVIASSEGVRPVQAVEPSGAPTQQTLPPPSLTEAPLPTVTFEPADAEEPNSPPTFPPARGVENSLELPPAQDIPPGMPDGSVLPPAAPVDALHDPAPFPTPAAPAATIPGNALPAKQAPQVELLMAAPESVGVGMPLTYELIVRNVGTTAVTQVRVEDELPARGSLVNTDPPAEATGGRLAWTVGTLDAGMERRIKVTVKLAEEGEVRSRATVSFAAAVDARVRVTRPRVTVAVNGPEAGTARVGERVPFQLRLTNSGSGPASRVVMQARFSDGLIHPHGALIEAELANLQAGQTKTITLEATAAKAGGQTCSITVVADGNAPESARAGVHLVEPLLTLRQTGPTRCLVKGEPAYSIELANPGTAATDPVTVWAMVPEGFEFVQASDGGAFNPSAKSVGWRLPGLPAGQSRSLSLKLRAVGPADGVIRTTAQAAHPTTDATTGAAVVAAGMRAASGARPLEARAETAVRAEGVPALRFDVTAAEGVVEVGKEAVYEIRVMNQGTGPCTGVQVVADLAEGTTAAGASGPSTARGSGQQITFEPLPQLGVRQEVTYRVRVRGLQPGDMRFRVRLSCNEIRTPTVKEENTRFFKE